MKILKDLLYSNDHEWVKVEGDKAYIGITDYAQHSLGDIVFIELPEVEDEISSQDVFGVIESVKAASDMFMPVDGKVVEINEDLVDDPALINADPYENWLLLVELTNRDQLGDLMNAKAYEEFCNEEA